MPASNSIATPVLSQNLRYVAIPDSQTGAIITTVSGRCAYTNIDAIAQGSVAAKLTEPLRAVLAIVRWRHN